MLHYGYRPAADTLGVFLPLLEALTQRRLEAKRRIRRARGPERSYWTGLSSSYKVLINSFYGYLAYGRANLNDFDAAEQVTTTGQKLIKEVLAALEARGCQIIEVDTDGAYFVPPPHVQTEAEEVELVEAVGRVLPGRIHLAHDGRYAGMVSLKPKTYFLLTYDGRLIAKGSSLRSRRDELYLRRFVQEAAITLIQEPLEEVSRRYLALAQRIQRGELPLDEFVRRESITAKTYSSPGLRRLAAAASGAPVGQKVEVYQREDGSLALAAEYRGDEDRDYLLRRLHDMARRFEGLAASRDEFKRLFPKLTAPREPTTDRPVQLTLFGPEEH
jgi:DNA polymerase elongation subunit (family B)